MWLMLDQTEPDDFVIATGETHTVREFLEESFALVGIDVQPNGKTGLEEEYIRTDTGDAVVKIDPRYLRPTEVDVLLGDSTKAKKQLKWQPQIKFKDLVKEMIEKDSELLHLELYGQRGRK